MGIGLISPTAFSSTIILYMRVGLMGALPNGSFARLQNPES
jgi:hypothetical protein